MNAGYPVVLDLSRLRVLVVGGGWVALRKVRGMLDAGGRPAVVAVALHPSLRALLDEHVLECEQRPFRDEDVRGMALVVAATDDPAVNRAVAAAARAAGALVSSVDAGDQSDFHLPATLRQDAVLVAVSTAGASPLFAQRLLARIEALVTPGVGRAARRLEQLRRQLRAGEPDAERRRAAWMRLMNDEFLDAAIAGRDDDVEQHIARCQSQS